MKGKRVRDMEIHRATRDCLESIAKCLETLSLSIQLLRFDVDRLKRLPRPKKARQK
jgi:hypothetical protein